MIKYIKEEKEFYELIKNDTYIIDFYASWCSPCKLLENILEEITFADIIKVDVDEFPDLAKRFAIMSIPTLLFFGGGLEMEREIGFRNLEQIKETFDKIQLEQHS